MKIFRVALIGVIALGVPLGTRAQEVPKTVVSGGYSFVSGAQQIFLHPFLIGPDPEAHGWFVDLVGNVTPHFGVVVQFAANQATDVFSAREQVKKTRALTFLGGVRLSSRCCESVVPFTHVLPGLVHSTVNYTSFSPIRPPSNVKSSQNSFTTAFGGGVETNGIVGLRVAADLIRLNPPFGSSVGTPAAWTWRVHAGLVIPIH